MQAIRVLRAQSRPASPAALPNPVHEPNNLMSSSGYNGPKLAQTSGLVEEQSQQRPTSAMARIQSLAPFHKRATPTPPPTPVPSTIVQDGTYLNTLGLKLNEAASRVLVTANGTGPDVWKGKKPLPSGRGRQFAALIETELDASQGNSNLRHAILRLLPRSLSVVISTLSAQISQFIPTPGFVPSSVMALPHPATLHALAYANFAAEVLETFVTYKLGTTNQDLIITRTSLEAIVTRVTSPLFTQMQTEMAALIEPLGHRSTSGTSSPSSFSGAKLPKPHPAIATINQHLPHFAKALKRCTFPSCASTQSALASFFITSIWQALVQIAHRQPPVKGSQVSLTGIGPTPPHSPPVKKASLPASPSMKKLTPPSSPLPKKRVLPLSDSPPKLSLRLRQVPSAGSLVSRAASPDIRNKDHGLVMTVYPSTSWLASSLVDAKAILDLLASTELPRPSESSLAREAVDEAVERLATFKEWLAGPVMDGGKLIEHVPEDLPLLIVLPLVMTEAWLDYSAQGNGESEYVCMGRLIGYENNDAYRRNVLCGFGRAEECEAIVGGRVLERLKAMDRWEAPNNGSGEGWIGGLVRWLESQLPSS
ncbi:hypothetical protein CPB86DRAFT_817227 [Serendipita vermifera]|nr:hypothetical protein CPB86DRAFT_817227 [Serendipita vermifera]